MRSPGASQVLCCCFAGLLLAWSASAAPNATSSSATTTTQNATVVLTTSSVTVTGSTVSNGQNVPFTTIMPSIFNLTLTPTPTSSAAPNSTVSASASPTPAPIVLETRLDPAFGVLGGLLIITGSSSAFWGHKNRWTSFFLSGFYTLSLVCCVLILKFGVLPAVNPPNKTLRGMFVLSSAIAGVAGGGIAIFFWKGAKYFIGAWGGFALALFVQALHDGGLIQPIGGRWIFFIGCALVGFIFCTIPKLHYHTLLVSTAFVGASAFMLGVDCFTTAGLKEFYLWNIGFQTLFPKFTSHNIQFPVSQAMQIELGLLAAVALMGVSVQLRILKVLQRKLHEIAEEQKKRDEEAEMHATERFAEVMREREAWEKDHPTLGKHGRQDSGHSGFPLMKYLDGSPSPSAEEHISSSFTHVNNDRRPRSGVSEFFAAPTPDEELRRAARSPGVLPALELGLNIQEDVPSNFMATQIEKAQKKELTLQELETLKRKEELKAEIQNIRKSIEVLKTETSSPLSSPDRSRHASLTSRRTLSFDAGVALQPGPSHLRPPRENDPRTRTQSMELGSVVLGESISRPSSAPLRDQEWDAYVRDRKLLQPPSGVSPPIATTSAPRVPVSQAVADALNERKRRESIVMDNSSEDVPVAILAKRHAKKTSSSDHHTPIQILPPRKVSAPVVAPTPQRATRTRTFEELNERHRERMRDLQAPLTQAEKEHADLEAAKSRWERAKALEKNQMSKRESDKAAALAKQARKSKSGTLDNAARKSLAVDDKQLSRQSRSLSADKLGAGGSSSKRLSMMKVEDWQAHQDAEFGARRRSPRPDAGGSGNRRNSRAPRN